MVLACLLTPPAVILRSHIARVRPPYLSFSLTPVSERCQSALVYEGIDSVLPRSGSLCFDRSFIHSFAHAPTNVGAGNLYRPAEATRDYDFVANPERRDSRGAPGAGVVL